MPQTAKTDIEVAQRAMVMVGMEPLSSFTEGTDCLLYTSDAADEP